MERAGIKVDRAELARQSARISPQRLARAGGRDPHARRPRVQRRLAQAAGRDPVRRDEACRAASKGKTGAYATDADGARGARRRRAHDLPARVLDWRQLAKLKSTYVDALVEQIDPETGRVHTSLCAWPSPAPGGCHRPIPTCRTSRSAPRKAARSAAPSSAEPGACAAQRRLFADRVAAARPPGRHPGAERGLPRTARTSTRSPPSQVFGVPVDGMDPDGPPPRQGDQLRHHLRHLGLRPGAPARHLAGRGRRVSSTPISTRYPGIRDYMEATEGGGARARLRRPPCSAASCMCADIASKNPARCAATPSAPPSTRPSRAAPPTSSSAP